MSTELTERRERFERFFACLRPSWRDGRRLRAAQQASVTKRDESDGSRRHCVRRVDASPISIDGTFGETLGLRAFASPHDGVLLPAS